MTLLRRSAASLVALVALAAVTPTTASALPAAGPDTGRPEVGSCHAISADEAGAVAEPKPAVSCDKRHTTRTITVTDVPKSIKMNDFEALLGLVNRRCNPDFADALGRNEATRLMTAYGISWFIPTKKQIDQGARWVRCDITLYGGKTLVNLPTDKEPALKAGKVPDSVAKCLDVTQKHFYYTVCARSHNYRAKGTFAMAGKKYPSRDAFLAAVDKRCPRIAGSQRWYATWPGEQGWKSGGERLVVCYRSTSK